MTRTGSAQVLPHLGAFINDVSGLQCLRYVANYSIEACNVFGASQTMQHRAPRRPLEEKLIYARGDMAAKTGARGPSPGRQRVKGGGSLLCGARGARGFLGGNWKVRGCLFLSTTLNLGTLKPPLARHAKCYDLFGPYAVRYNDNGAPDWMQVDVCMRRLLTT